MARPVWSARCKSGLQFRRNGRGRWRPCRRVCSRGELLCADCATAEVIPAEHRETISERMARSVRVLAYSLRMPRLLGVR